MSQKFEQFGKYILLEKLASGGMAEVFLARAPGAGGINKFVAIKRILPQYSDHAEFIQMFKDEAKIAINLSHSNIVSIYEFGIERRQFFLVMDYVEGRNLRQILNKMKKAKTKLSTEQIVYIVKEVAAGLDSAHRCLDGTTGKPLNITHRDMSPQNVMISFEGEVKIIDFGIAKAESQLETTRAGTLKGKFGYMSPEQAEGQPVDLRTDIFSLGIVLWELLAEDRLFIANNEINTLRKIRDCQVPSLRKINPNIHAELERITMKALARDRNMRYQTAAAMQRDLNRFLNRQYPDFSPQDLSVSIKSLYADEILETRRRLVAYSQMDTSFPENTLSSVTISGHNHTLVTEKSIVGRTKTEVDTEKNDPSAVTALTQSEVDFSRHTQTAEPPKKINIGANTGVTSTETEIERTVPASATGLDERLLERQLQLGQSGLGGAQQIPSVHDTPPPKRPDQEETEHRTVPSRPKDRQWPQIHVPWTPLMFVAIVGALAYFVYAGDWLSRLKPMAEWVMNLPSIAVEQVSNLSSQSKPDDVGPTVNPNAPTQEPNLNADFEVDDSPGLDLTTSIVINSRPSGAEIFLDGKSTGKLTPSRIDIPLRRPFSLVLKKDRYIDYVTGQLVADQLPSKSLNATLQRAMIGFLDIDVKPPHNVNVYINNQKLKGERLPITLYAVPAGTKVSVRAVNPIDGLSVEESVILQQDERKSIVLHLKNGTKPSHKRQPSQSH